MINKEVLICSLQFGRPAAFLSSFNKIVKLIAFSISLYPAVYQISVGKARTSFSIIFYICRHMHENAHTQTHTYTDIFRAPCVWTNVSKSLMATRKQTFLTSGSREWLNKFSLGCWLFAWFSYCDIFITKSSLSLNGTWNAVEPCLFLLVASKASG